MDYCYKDPQTQALEWDLALDLELVLVWDLESVLTLEHCFVVITYMEYQMTHQEKAWEKPP